MYFIQAVVDTRSPRVSICRVSFYSFRIFGGSAVPQLLCHDTTIGMLSIRTTPDLDFVIIFVLHVLKAILLLVTTC